MNSATDYNELMNSMDSGASEYMDINGYSVSNTITNNFTINGAEGQDPEEIAAAVQSMINDQFDSERSAFA